MDVGIIGGGINGLCCAWRLAERGHRVTLYDRGGIMQATSRASSKLLHGGLRYLENGELRLVREALRERDAWLTRTPALAWPIRLTLPIYRGARRPRWMIGLGLFAYDHIAGRTDLPRAQWRTAEELVSRDPRLASEGLIGGYDFSDGQMDDLALGRWVAQQAVALGVEIREGCEVTAVRPDGSVIIDGAEHAHDRVINAAGPWAAQLLEQSGVPSPYHLDLVRGSHLVLADRTDHAYLVEVPGERRIAFVLPWKGGTLVGTTEVRQTLTEPIRCDASEVAYLSALYRHYFPGAPVTITETFAGVRPLLRSNADPSRATREYALHRNGRLVTIFGGKWTTANALATKVSALVL